MRLTFEAFGRTLLELAILEPADDADDPEPSSSDGVFTDTSLGMSGLGFTAEAGGPGYTDD